jgi:alpha-tubulin suppressor-like RCC1 family protein
MTARPSSRLLALALLGALLGACGGTLYDAAGVPPLAAGATCQAPTHLCGGQCVSQTPAACGAGCDVCSAPAGALAATCDPAGGGAFACGYACAAGQLHCPGGCCQATAVAAGEAHACAITDAGSLVCWGANAYGQLGPAAAGTVSPTPRQVFPDGVTAVAAGGRHTCAVHQGAVWCWGDGRLGQLGTGAMVGGSAPVAAGVTATAATKLALGADHSCAITGGVVTCWGANAVGQLGRGDILAAPTAKTTPVPSGAALLSAGGDTTCAATNVDVRCWGANESGQAGGALAPRLAPGSVAGAGFPTSSPVALAVGRRHACAAFGPGAGLGLWCWGADDQKQLGDGLQAPGGPSAVPASKLDNNAASEVVSAGGDFTCSSKGPLELVCSGLNDQAQAGLDPLSGTQLEKNDVAFGTDLAGLSSGAAFSCALVGPVAQRGVKCWGANGAGQLGRDTAGADQATPEFVTP